MTAFLERLRKLLPGGDGPARVVQALPLGGGARLLIVEFGGTQVLVGQGRGGLVSLSATNLISAAGEEAGQSQ